MPLFYKNNFSCIVSAVRGTGKVVGVQRREGAVLESSQLSRVLFYCQLLTVGFIIVCLENLIPCPTGGSTLPQIPPWPSGATSIRGKGGGCLGALGCRSQLPLSNFRRGVQEQCGVENFPNLSLSQSCNKRGSERWECGSLLLTFSESPCGTSSAGAALAAVPPLLFPFREPVQLESVHLPPSSQLCLFAGKRFFISGRREFHKVIAFSTRTSLSPLLPVRAFRSLQGESLKVWSKNSTGRYRQQTGAKPAYERCLLILFGWNQMIWENPDVMPTLPGDEKERRSVKLD